MSACAEVLYRRARGAKLYVDILIMKRRGRRGNSIFLSTPVENAHLAFPRCSAVRGKQHSPIPSHDPRHCFHSAENSNVPLSAVVLHEPICTLPTGRCGTDQLERIIGCHLMR